MATTYQLHPVPHVTRPVLPARVAAFGLIAAFAALNVLYLAYACPHDLAPDEAHYWDWSRHVDWAYYSKGPLVAWLIRGSCELFGTTPLAVRLPAVGCNVALLAALYRLTATAFAPRLGVVAVALVVTLPPLTAGAVLMTIDAPLLACWGWAAVFVREAVRGDRLRDWLAAGVLTAVGVLAKYTMLLVPACVGLFLLADPTSRRRLFGRGFVAFVAVSLLGLLPILGWNATHDWVGVRHLAAIGGVDPVKKVQPTNGGPLEYVIGQAAALVGGWLVLWAMAVRGFVPRPGSDPTIRLLWALSVPVWGLFAVASCFVKPQVNWPAAAYVTGFPLAVGWVAGARSPWVRWLLAATVVVGLVGMLFARFPGPIRPLLALVAGSPTADRPAPVRRFDPSCRLAGWRRLAETVDAVRDRVRTERGIEPLVAAMNWTMPGELGFYCRGNPTVYSFGPGLRDRHSQYDVWRPNPVADAQAFRGATFVYVGDAPPELRRAFDRVSSPVEVIASDGGIPVADWTVWVLEGFRGFEPGDRPTGRGY